MEKLLSQSLFLSLHLLSKEFKRERREINREKKTRTARERLEGMTRMGSIKAYGGKRILNPIWGIGVFGVLGFRSTVSLTALIKRDLITVLFIAI